MRRDLVRTLNVLITEVRRYDVIRVAGAPHQIVDLRLAGATNRRVLTLDDGNTLTYSGSRRVEVLRAYASLVDMQRDIARLTPA